MINMNKNTEAILQSHRYQNIAKERHSQINKTMITNFGIRSSRIFLISNMLMEEERTWNSGKPNNWATGSKTSAKFTASSCGMSIHSRPQSASQPFKTLDLPGRLKRGVQVKGPSTREKNTGWLRKGNMSLSIVHYGKWSYINNNDVLTPRFLKIPLYKGKR